MKLKIFEHEVITGLSAAPGIAAMVRGVSLPWVVTLSLNLLCAGDAQQGVGWVCEYGQHKGDTSAALSVETQKHGYYVAQDKKRLTFGRCHCSSSFLNSDKYFEPNGN